MPEEHPAEAELHQQLDHMITGYWVSQAIYVAAKYNIADHLQNGPQPVTELATLTGTHAKSLYRLLRALASVGIFAEGDGQHFSLTPLAEPLLSKAPNSKRLMALMAGDETYRAWAALDYSVETGQVAYEKVHGQPLFEYLGEHPDKASIFDGAMQGFHAKESAAVSQAYDFSCFVHLTDIGGGNGSQLCTLLQDNPGLYATLFDLPHVIERAKSVVQSAGVTDRCDFVTGNFFESVPAGADAYLMRHIIHDWSNEQCLTILSNCHQAMSAESKLLIIESVIPPGNEPFGGKFLDLAMLVIPGGKERTAEEYRTLLDQAGFTLDRIVPTQTEVSIIESVKQ